MLLVVNHVSHGLLIVFNLLELDRQHVIELRKILFHIVDGNFLRYLIIDGFDTPVKLTLH